MPLTSDLTLSVDGRALTRPLRQWRGFAAEHVVLGSEPYSFERQGETHYLALHDLAVDDGEVVIDGMATDRTRNMRESVAFIPRGRRTSGWMTPKHRHNTLTALYFDPGLVSEELERRYDEQTPDPFLFVRPPALQATLAKLEHLLKAPAVDDLLAESVCLVAALEVFAVQADPLGTGLSERQLARVEAYVDARLGEEIALSDLAALCGLSRFHFSRAFKKAAGVPPYAFVMQRRIERAKELLTTTALPIEAIGTLVGFPSASQFRRAFRMRTGGTAQEFRK